MTKCVVIELDHDNCDLYSQEFDDRDDALAYIEETERKCYLIVVEAPLQCESSVKVDVEPHT